MRLNEEMIERLSSIVEVSSGNLHHVFRSIVLLKEGLAAILLLVLVHIVDLLDASLLDDLGAAEAGIVCGIEAAPDCLVDPHLDDGRLLGMQAQTLV